MKSRSALYARVSTAHQEHEQTIASQVEALERAAQAAGMSIAPERRYIDEGFSGSRLDRPRLDALRDAAADGLLDHVFVYCPDRLARNYVHQHVLIEELNRRGVEVHFVEHPVGERAEDRLLVQMQGVIAEYERAKILERTRRGRLHKLRTGQSLPFTKRALYGYAVTTPTGGSRRTIVINEVEAQHVRAMFRWVEEEGLSARAVAKRLNAQGVRPRQAECWRGSVVYRMLTNPAYTGLAAYNRRESCEPQRPTKPGAYRKQLKSSARNRPREQWLTVPIPPIIDTATQQRVLQKLAKNKILSPRNVQHEYLLRTLVVCGQCGRRMLGVPRKVRGQYEYFYYMCPPRNPVDRGRWQRCDAPCVRRDDLDRLVWEALAAWVQSPAMLHHEVEAWQASQQGATHRARDRVRLEGAARRLEGQIQRLVDAYVNGAISVQELKARRERLDGEKQALQLRIEDLDAQEQDQARLDRLSENLEDFAATLRDGLEKLDFQGRQQLVRLLIERVVVTGSHVAIEHAIPLSGRFCPLRLPRRRTQHTKNCARGRSTRRGAQRAALDGCSAIANGPRARPGGTRPRP